MKLNRILLSGLIWIANLVVILWYILKIIINAKRGKNSPTLVTRCMNRGSRQLLTIVQAAWDTTVKQPIHFDPTRIYLFMSNHLSAYDMPLILAALPGHIRFIAKKELFAIPAFGKALTYSDIVAVDPQDHRLNAATFVRIKQTALEKNLHFWAFPEGSRSNGTHLLPFKAGIFRLAKELGAIIIPVGIWGTQTILPNKSLVFGKRGAKLSISIGNPVDSLHYRQGPLPVLIQSVESAIRELVYPS